MAAKKKQTKSKGEKSTKSKKSKDKSGKKSDSGSGGGGGRGRKAVLKGDLDQEQKKRVRRMLRAKGVELSKLEEGVTAEAKVLKDTIKVSIGKDTYEMPKEPRPRGSSSESK